MANSLRYQIPYMEAAQSQKHVTHNDAVRILDQVLNANAKDKDLATPPGSPATGDSYIIAASPTGAWASKAGYFTSYIDGAWLFVAPIKGFRVYVDDEALYYRYSGSVWVQEPDSVLVATKRLVQGSFGSFIDIKTIEEEVTVSGASTNSTIVLPNRSIVLGVSTRVTQAITGATSFGCGISGDDTKFGATLGIALNSTNIGVIGPTAFYADTAIKLTANGSNFTGGKVRVAAQYLLPGAPTS